MLHQLIAFMLALSSLLPHVSAAEEASQFYDSKITVRLQDAGEMKELSLHDYLIDVVLQEMPASFESEALKAQAVAARTFTLRSIYCDSQHEDADVCGESVCCQCYMDEQEGRAAYGDRYEESRSKVEEAVSATDGVVLVCDDELIEAVYFSSAGGRTESASAVWGNEVSYLQTVESPEEIRITDFAVDTASFCELLGRDDLSGSPASWFGAVSYTDGGSVDYLEIGGIPYRGTELRSMFGLRSANFCVSVVGDEIHFEVSGSGHGVGMSQYGANEMALQGATYQSILTHYYTGAELKQLY